MAIAFVKMKKKSLNQKQVQSSRGIIFLAAFILWPKLTKYSLSCPENGIKNTFYSHTSDGFVL